MMDILSIDEILVALISNTPIDVLHDIWSSRVYDERLFLLFSNDTYRPQNRIKLFLSKPDVVEVLCKRHDVGHCSSFATFMDVYDRKYQFIDATPDYLTKRWMRTFPSLFELLRVLGRRVDLIDHILESEMLEYSCPHLTQVCLAVCYDVDLLLKYLRNDDVISEITSSLPTEIVKRGYDVEQYRKKSKCGDEVIASKIRQIIEGIATFMAAAYGRWDLVREIMRGYEFTGRIVHSTKLSSQAFFYGNYELALDLSSVPEDIASLFQPETGGLDIEECIPVSDITSKHHLRGIGVTLLNKNDVVKYYSDGENSGEYYELLDPFDDADVIDYLHSIGVNEEDDSVQNLCYYATCLRKGIEPVFDLESYRVSDVDEWRIITRLHKEGLLREELSEEFVSGWFHAGLDQDHEMMTYWLKLHPSIINLYCIDAVKHLPDNSRIKKWLSER